MTPPTKAMLELEVLPECRIAGACQHMTCCCAHRAMSALRSSQNKGDSGERDRVIEEALVQSASALAATISLLQRIPKAKMVAPSNKMFDQMMRDYEAALENARVVLCALKSGEKGS